MLRQLGARAGEEITPVTALCMAVYGNANGMIARKKSAEIPLSSDNVKHISRSGATTCEFKDETRPHVYSKEQTPQHNLEGGEWRSAVVWVEEEKLFSSYDQYHISDHGRIKFN